MLEPPSSPNPLLSNLGEGGWGLKVGILHLIPPGYLRAQETSSKAAIADFSTAIKLKPDLVEAYLSRGVAHSLTKNHKAEIADYTKALELKPTRADAYLNRADDLFVLGDKAKAIAPRLPRRINWRYSLPCEAVQGSLTLAHKFSAWRIHRDRRFPVR